MRRIVSSAVGELGRFRSCSVPVAIQIHTSPMNNAKKKCIFFLFQNEKGAAPSACCEKIKGNPAVLNVKGHVKERACMATMIGVRVAVALGNLRGTNNGSIALSMSVSRAIPDDYRRAWVQEQYSTPCSSLRAILH
jgi:hypothetical protein